MPFRDQLSQNERKTISITLSIPIFNCFQVRNNVRSARIAVLNRKLALESTKQSLYNEIRRACANVVAADETYNSIRDFTIAAKKKFQQTKVRFQIGKATPLEYNEAKTNYFQSLSEEQQAKFDMIFRCKILDFYNGRQIYIQNESYE
jgi:outer membrane protein